MSTNVPTCSLNLNIGAFVKGVRVKIGDKSMTLGEGTIVSSDLPLRMCLPIVGKPQGVLEIGHYLVSNLTLDASYAKRSSSTKLKKERDFESKKCFVIECSSVSEAL
jgi:hypothetical protein